MGDSPALARGPLKAMKLTPAMFFNRVIIALRAWASLARLESGRRGLTTPSSHTTVRT